MLSGDKDEPMDLRDSDDDHAQASMAHVSEEQPCAGWTADQVDEEILTAAPGPAPLANCDHVQQ